MIRRPPRSTLFPTRRSSDLNGSTILIHHLNQKVTFCPRRRISGRLQADEHSRHLERNAVGCPQAWNVQAARVLQTAKPGPDVNVIGRHGPYTVAESSYPATHS